MGFTSALTQAIDYWYDDSFKKALAFKAFNVTPPTLRNYVIGIEALYAIEKLAVIFALVASCYYSLTGDLLSNSDQMYALLGMAAASTVIGIAINMKATISNITVLNNIPSRTMEHKDYFKAVNARSNQINARNALVTTPCYSLATIGALFAIIISCYYFQTNNLLSSDLEAHLLMAGGATSFIIPSFLMMISQPLTFFRILDRYYMEYHAPPPPEPPAQTQPPAHEASPQHQDTD